MKKIFALFVVSAALIFVVSCGGGSKTSDTTDTGDSEPADDSEPSGDTDSEDPENPDTTPDNGDSQPDGGDSAPDNGDTAPDNDADTDSGDTVPDQDTDADTGSTEEHSEGIYLGIIGFNYQLNIRELSYLTNSNMTEFQDFIEDFEMDDGTALYFADYTALKMMQNYTPVPPKLQTVALVTFTDGEDTSSDGPVNDPENYNDPDVYLNAIHNKIVTNGIHGLSVEAYSIGLRSGDTGSDFKSRLEKLASSSDKAFEVSDMEEVQERFTKIAEDLYSVFKTINIDFKVLGNYSDGTRMRFSLDIYCDHDENECEKNGKNSNLYIDATYRRNGNERSFENFAYYGFSGNLTTVKCGERDQKGFYPCKFENLKYDNMDTEIKQIELWKNDNNEWKHENEALKQEDSSVNESKSSALIMLVLDCTTSLGNSKFKKLQEAGKDFIETLVNGGSAVMTTPCDDNPCVNIANSTEVCTPSGPNYICGCIGEYEWNGSQCVKPATPCEPNPCTSISNSTGVCTVSGTGYTCGCQSGYNWSGTQCIDTAAEECATLGGTWNSSNSKCTRTQNCSSKPSNTVWNTVSSITQTWNGSSWEPGATTTHSDSPSTNECHYKCATGYNWNDTQCVDAAEEECATLGGNWNSSTSKCTRIQNCSAKPANTVWNTVSNITQTWNNGSWSPSTESNYNNSSSTQYCYYKCAEGYEWNDSQCSPVPSEPTDPNIEPTDPYDPCSSTSCYDSTTNLAWSAEWYTMTPTWSQTTSYSQAVSYCDNLNQDGHTDWHLPTISELRTLIKNCAGTATNGSCGVIDTGNSSTSCLSSGCYTSNSCSSCANNRNHSKLGDFNGFWSSSTLPDCTNCAWYVGFGSGTVNFYYKSYDFHVRCVRSDTNTGDTDTDTADTDIDTDTDVDTDETDTDY